MATNHQNLNGVVITVS